MNMNAIREGHKAIFKQWGYYPITHHSITMRLDTINDSNFIGNSFEVSFYDDYYMLSLIDIHGYPWRTICIGYTVLVNPQLRFM